MYTPPVAPTLRMPSVYGHAKARVYTAPDSDDHATADCL